MNRKVYFAGSIRGGRADAGRYKQIIDHINKTDEVLTEHVGDGNLSLKENGRSRDAFIYNRDMNWMRQCNLVIAECTCPSLGVGYELASAKQLGKPVYIFYDHSKTELSAMLTGDPYFTICSYQNKEEIFRELDKILKFEII